MRWSAWSPENACRLQVPHGQRSHARVAVADGGHCSSQKLEERAEHERTACRAARNGASCAAPTRQFALRLLAAALLRAPRAHRAFLCAIAFDAGGGVCFLVLPPSGGRSSCPRPPSPPRLPISPETCLTWCPPWPTSGRRVARASAIGRASQRASCATGAQIAVTLLHAPNAPGTEAHGCVSVATSSPINASSNAGACSCMSPKSPARQGAASAPRQRRTVPACWPSCVARPPSAPDLQRVPPPPRTMLPRVALSCWPPQR